MFFPKIRPAEPIKVLLFPITYVKSVAEIELFFPSIIPQVFENLHCSTLFVFITRSLASVVPMNCSAGLVPALPASHHTLLFGVCQLALPDASVVST